MNNGNLETVSESYIGISKDMVDLYLRLAPEYLRCLQIAGTNRNDVSMRFYAHKLASVLGVMGFSDLQYCVAKVEGEEFDRSSIDTFLETVAREVNASIEHLERYQ